MVGDWITLETDEAMKITLKALKVNNSEEKTYISKEIIL